MLLIEDGCLWTGQPTRRLHPATAFPFADVSRGEPISLAEIIAAGVHLGEKVKQMAAILLAYAVLYLDEWLDNDWSSVDVHFHQFAQGTTTRIPLHPYILRRFDQNTVDRTETGLSNQDSNLEDDQTHQYPGLLALGIILMELSMNQLIPELVPDFKSTMSVTDKHIMAMEAFESCRSNLGSDLNVGICKAIDLCLNGNFGMCDDGFLEREQLGESIYKEIITPLEETLWKSYGPEYVKNIDEWAPQMDINNRGVFIALSSPLEEQTTHSRIAMPPRATGSRNLRNVGRFFDDVSSNDNSTPRCVHIQLFH